MYLVYHPLSCAKDKGHKTVVMSVIQFIRWDRVLRMFLVMMLKGNESKTTRLLI